MKNNSKELIDSSIKELTKDLDNGYSDRIKEYFEWKARFHNYSFWNSFLIMFQRPSATFVKGYVQWKEMGYHVNKGAKAITIMAPMKAKYIFRDKEKIFWKDMTELERKRKSEHKTIDFFRDVYVFDIKDTNCTEYPTFFTGLGDSNKDSYLITKDRLIKSGISIEEVAVSHAEGSFNLVDKTINIKKGDYTNMLLALLHETAHYVCDTQIEDYKKLYDYKAGELHAESVAFITAKFLGIDNPFSKDYILNWKGNAAKVREHLGLIDKVATIIIKMIEGEVNATEKPVQQTG
jgi:hypothetical protein